MHRSILAVFFVFTAAISTLNAQVTFKNAVDYNDFIVNEQNKIGVVINDFMKACGKGKLKDMDTRHADVIKQIDASLVAINAMPAYKGNVGFRDAASELFEVYKSIAQREYRDIIALMNEGIDVGQNRARFNNVLFKIDEKSKPFSDKFLTEQIKFAETFKISLGANELEKQEEQKDAKP